MDQIRGLTPLQKVQKSNFYVFFSIYYFSCFNLSTWNLPHLSSVTSDKFSSILTLPRQCMTDAEVGLRGLALTSILLRLLERRKATIGLPWKYVSRAEWCRKNVDMFADNGWYIAEGWVVCDDEGNALGLVGKGSVFGFECLKSP